MQGPAPIAEWSAKPGDPRRSITVDQLLRMVSGIGCGQSLKTGFTAIFDADTQMEFDIADQSAFAANASLRANPGSEWRYTNCNFILLSRIIRDAAGGDAKSSRKFIERELFAPLGFEQATSNTTAPASRLERFISGPVPAIGHAWPVVPAGRSSGARATHPTRRLGRLLGPADPAKRQRVWLRRGLLDPARKLLPPARASPPASQPTVSWPKAVRANIDRCPPHDLVIVKFGWAYTPHDDHVAVERLVRETMAALQSKE